MNTWKKNLNSYDHNTGLRYYENKDVIVITALKVASRFCDNYFYDDQLDKVKNISFKDGKFYSNDYTSGHNTYTEDGLLNNILKGKEKRKIIFLYRDPIERFISTLNYFYTNFLCNIILDYERYPLSDSVFAEGSAYADDEQLTKDRNDIPQKVKDCITDKFFQELHTSNIHWQSIRHETRGKDGKIIQVIGTDDTIRLNQMADIFLNYESEKVFDVENQSNSKDPHYSSYIKSYNEIINDKNCKNITIFNIDNNNLGELFRVESQETHINDTSIHAGSNGNPKWGRTNPHTKDILRNALQKSYRFKTQVEEKFNQEMRELTQLKLWKI
jgi:hypothetical protein